MLGGRCRRVLSKHDDLILGLGEFPASEDEQVRSNSCAGVVTDVAAFFPLHGLCVPDHEVVAVIFLGIGKRISFDPRVEGPTTKQEDFTG